MTTQRIPKRSFVPIPQLTTPLVARFWASTEQLASGCWERKHGTTRKADAEYRYDSFPIGGGKNKSIKSHRMAYAIYNSTDPQGMQVCHTCDNTKCVNPLHLFLGTHAENMADKARKGRAPAMKGSRHPLAKLNDVKVAEIRSKYSTGTSQSALGREYGVTQAAIWYIVTGKHWTESPSI